jgi:hypothetical protein
MTYTKIERAEAQTIGELALHALKVALAGTNIEVKRSTVRMTARTAF